MPKLNLKNAYLIQTFLVLYLLFSLVYPFIHFHWHHNENEEENNFCFHHFADYSDEHEGCEHHNKDHDHHNHFHGDWNQIILTNSKDVFDFFTIIYLPNAQSYLYEPQFLCIITTFPSLVKQIDAVFLLSARSPPRVSAKMV